MKTLTLIALLLFAPLSAIAQGVTPWENISELPGQPLEDFWPGDSVIGVRDIRGQLFLSRDNGLSWEPKGFLMRSLHVGRDRTMVAVSDKNEILYSSDNGRTFQLVAGGVILPDVPGRLLGDGSYVYFLCHTQEQTRVFRSVNGGRTWEEIEALPRQIWLSAVGPDGTLYVAQHRHNQLLRYGSGDTAWSVASTAPNDLYTIRFGRDGRLYAIDVGEKLYRSEVGRTELTRFIADSAYPTGHYFFPTDFVVNSRGEIYTPLNHLNEPPWFVRYSADGTRQQQIPVDVNYVNLNLILGPYDDLWLVYIGYGIYRFDSSAAGYEFHPMNFPGYARVGHLTTAPGGELIVTANNSVYSSVDEGGTLVEMKLPVRRLLSNNTPLFIDSLRLLFLGYESTDFGKTWDTAGRTIRGIRGFIRLENGMLFSTNHYNGSHVVIRSTDNGMTWHQIDGVHNYDIYSLYMYSRGNMVYAATHSWVYSTIFFSPDWGETWDTVWISPIGEPLRLYQSWMNTGVVTANGTLIVGYGSYLEGETDYTIFRFADRSRVRRPLPCNDMSTSYRFAADREGRPWLVMACGLFRSDDDGLTWTKVADIPEGRQPTALLINKSGTFLLGTNEGLFKAEQVSSVSTTTMVAGERVSIRTIPNPTSGSAQIRFVLAAPSHVRVDLFDQLGQRVLHILEGDYGSGEHPVQLEGLREQAAGSYHLVIDADGVSASENIIILPD